MRVAILALGLGVAFSAGAEELSSAPVGASIAPETYLLLQQKGLLDTGAVDPTDPEAVGRMVDEAIQRFLDQQLKDLKDKEKL